MKKTGIIIPSWNDLRTNKDALKQFIDRFKDEAVIVLSKTEARVIPTIFRDYIKKSYIADTRTLSISRLMNLCDEIFEYNGKDFVSLPIKKSVAQAQTKLGFIVSNGFGLGHVARMQTFAEGLKNFAPLSIMSFSAGLRGDDILYLPSAQYLELNDMDGDVYTYESVRRFLEDAKPSHIFYDGNVLPPGLLRALSHRPEIHLTWIRRAMWQPNVAAQYMAQQAMADLVIEPGDIAQSYDTGSSWQGRHDYVPPRNFLQTMPVKPQKADLDRTAAQKALNLNPENRYALLMLGAMQKSEDLNTTRQTVEAVKKTGLIPVIAHWPISHDAAPKIDGAIIIEQMPIAPYYNAFDIIISAAGYNSFHEIMASDIKAVFIPQEDAGRDQQLARAQYAADKGHAQLCRRADLSNLNKIIQTVLGQPKKPLESAAWLEDWQGIFNAIHGTQNNQSGKSVKQASATKRLLKIIFKRWRSENKPYNARFVLALNMTYETFSRKLKPSALQTIVITNGIDPIALRRGGYKYVWVNDTALKSRLAIFRQMMNWLNVWRPQEMIIL